LTKGRIAVLSPLAAANGLVRLWPQPNKCLLGPTWVSPKRHLDRFSRFCVHCSKGSPCFSVGRTTTKICRFPLGDRTPLLMHGSWGPPELALQTVFRSV